MYMEKKRNKEFLLKEPLKEGEIIDTDDLRNFDGKQIVYTINSKKRHVWIWSAEPDKGKSTFLRHLCEKYRA